VSPGHTPTEEQQKAVDAFVAGGTVAITAGAGAGKTSTLRLLAESRPAGRGLYLAFNKAVQVEAARSFPANVTAKTAHALAFRTHGLPLRARLGGPRLSAAQVAQALGMGPVMLDTAEATVVVQPAQVAALAMGSVLRFCRSADPEIGPSHFVAPQGAAGLELSTLAEAVLGGARRAWEDLTSHTGRLKAAHDHYLKAWALSGPGLGFDFILYDEAQDADPCIAGVVLAQEAQLVAVGDPHQALYAWRGNADLLSALPADHRVSLTRSWRFGDPIAAEANLWLALLGAELRIRGNPARASRLEALEAPDAVLTRTNAGAVRAVMAAHEAGRKVALVGGGREVLRLAEAAHRMAEGLPSGHPELVAFSTWDQVVDYAESDPSGSDLATSVKLVCRFGPDAVIEAVGGAVTEARANLVVSTVHKAKGREWDRVRAGDDFPAPTEHDGAAGMLARSEAMLGYVAVTRARSLLDVGGLGWIHGHAARHGITTKSAGPGVESPDRVLAAVGLALGMAARVDGERGIWRLDHFSKDGSVTAFGGPAGQWRSFRPEWCYPAEQRGRGGRMRRGVLPAERRGLRAAWRAERGLVAPESPISKEVRS